MKLTISNRITSLFLAVLVVFSTLSFTVEKHFCGGHLVDVAVFSEVKKCGMDTSVMNSEKKSCCQDKVEVIKGLEDLKIDSNKDLVTVQIAFVKSSDYKFEVLYVTLPKQINPHKNYAPPNLVAEITILQETFLI